MSAALLLAAALAPAGLGAQTPRPGWDWRETTTPHFRLLHQNAWLPGGLTIGIERIHFRLGMDLGAFSPWMAKERISLYVYKDLQSYVGGEFSPPPWSNGVAIYAKKAVAVPAMIQTSQMLRVLAHETTHLLFVGYFREGHRDPPHWLNEGLAMLEEADSPEKPETSSWYQDMVAIQEKGPRSWLPMDRFLVISPTKDLHDDKAQVGEWYVQAYSVAHFLVRKHSRIQFKGFCARLRDGRSVEDALSAVYRYRTVADFEKRWLAWLAEPSHKRRVDALAASSREPGDGVIEKAGRGASSFRGFSTGREFKPPAGSAPSRESDQEQ